MLSLLRNTQIQLRGQWCPAGGLCRPSGKVQGGGMATGASNYKWPIQVFLYKIMMSICEHTCGFCSADKCFDLAPDCHSLRALCFNRPMSPMFRQQCPLTCGLCQPVQQVQTDNNGADENMGKAPRELIVLVRKKNGQRQKCEDLSPSCGDNEHICNDEVTNTNQGTINNLC